MTSDAMIDIRRIHCDVPTCLAAGTYTWLTDWLQRLAKTSDTADQQRCAKDDRSQDPM